MYHLLHELVGLVYQRQVDDEEEQRHVIQQEQHFNRLAFL